MGDRGRMNKGFRTSPLSRLYDSPLNNMPDIELDALNNRKQQDRLVPCDYGDMKAWLQSGTNKIVPSLRDRFEGRHQKSGHLGRGWVSFPYTSFVCKDSHHHVVIGVLEQSLVGISIIINHIIYSVYHCSTEIHSLPSNINGGIHPVSLVGVKLLDNWSYPEWGMLTKLSLTLFLDQKVELDIGIKETVLCNESFVVEGLMVQLFCLECDKFFRGFGGGGGGEARTNLSWFSSSSLELSSLEPFERRVCEILSLESPVLGEGKENDGYFKN